MSSAMKGKACMGKVIFSFSCSANANPGVTSYQLFENETAILNTSAPGMWSGALKSQGIFVYKCVANNSPGSEYNMDVTVTVSGKQISPFWVGLGTIWKTVYIKTAFAWVYRHSIIKTLTLKKHDPWITRLNGFIGNIRSAATLCSWQISVYDHSFLSWNVEASIICHMQLYVIRLWCRLLPIKPLSLIAHC